MGHQIIRPGWFVNEFGKGRAAHRTYRSYPASGGRPVQMGYCGRKLPSPQPAPSEAPQCKSCLQAYASADALRAEQEKPQ